MVTGVSQRRPIVYISARAAARADREIAVQSGDEFDANPLMSTPDAKCSSPSSLRLFCLQIIVVELHIVRCPLNLELLSITAPALRDGQAANLR